ncbi:MAG TPA: diadenylate cyclase CdaA [Gemmatimonadaceae bacterium]|jgi:diadenylate cyclase|nr:diadenylate cyclase CdaA [Gemmatimonadaceae bacterium]
MTSIFDQFRFVDVGWRDVVEVAIVAFVLYRLLLLLHGTRAVQMLWGIVVLVFVYAVAWVLKLTMITSLLGKAFLFAPIAAVVIFATEIRAALAHLGQSRVTRFFKRLEKTEVAEEIADAVERLSRSGIGAIIAVEREMGLGDYLQSGSEMQARVSADLLTTIFTPYSPLHDGAVIVRGDSIIGAGTILPLSQAQIDDRSLGTRHRAALGLSEETDALVIVVSEETATISVASLGRLERGLTATNVRDLLSGKPLRTTAEHPTVELTA